MVVAEGETLEMGTSVIQLDETQEIAVNAGLGAWVVLAGPGSGKTRVLVERVACLIADGVPANRILCITFAKNAQIEMIERASERTGVRESLLRPTVCTFHSLGYRIIRRHAALLPFTLKPNPVDPSKIAQLVRLVMSDKNVVPMSTLYTYREVREFISMCKRGGLTPEDSGKVHTNFPYMPEIYAAYEHRKADEGLIDYDDMIFLAWQLLKKPEILEIERAGYDYIMVDEFHDTDPVQFEIARWLAEPTNNVFVVADVNQSIYGFRGAQPKLVLEFDQFYPFHETIYMGTNYRSVQRIIDFYRKVIEPSPMAVKEFLDSIKSARNGDESKNATPLTFHREASESKEAKWLADEIAGDRESGHLEAAVLARTNKYLSGVEQALFAAKIPYSLEGAGSFFDRKEVKDLLAFLRIVENREDDDALERVIRSQAECSKYLGVAFVAELRHQASGSLYEALSYSVFKKGFQERRARELYSFLSRLAGECRRGSVSKQLELILEATELIRALSENELTEDVDNLIVENMQEAVRSAKEFLDDRTGFLNYVATLAAEGVRQHRPDENAVRLMTIHKSKGLEFETVYLVGVSEGVLPHAKAGDVDEERRILYVGASRAKDRLFVSCSGRPSMFVLDDFRKVN